MDFLKNALKDPSLFCETRYKLIPSLPLKLGSISIGYSNNSIHIYFSSSIGQEGVIDWDLQTFLQKWRNAIHAAKFTPDIISLFQDITNQLMPGFEYDINRFHWFLRPHFQTSGTQIGFALCGSTSISILGGDQQSLSNLQFFSENLKTILPLSSFAFRRYSIPNKIGQIVCDLFVSIGTSQTIYLEIMIKFLFHPSKVGKHMFECVSKTNDDGQNMSSIDNESKSNRFTITDDDGYEIKSEDKKEVEVFNNGMDKSMNTTHLKNNIIMKYIQSIVDCNGNGVGNNVLLVNDWKGMVAEDVNIYGNEKGFWKLCAMIGFVMGMCSLVAENFNVSKEIVRYTRRIKSRM